jgi:transposase InsO family protein
VQEIVAESKVSLQEVLRVLGVCRSAYYSWERRHAAGATIEEVELRDRVRQIFESHHCRYGTRRIVATLRASGIRTSRERVKTIMKEEELRALQPRTFKPRTTESRHHLGYNENLLLEGKEVSRIDEVWVGDITYIAEEKGGFCYLALLMDLYSRRIVGWCHRCDMSEELVLGALRQAIALRQPQGELIHHSDRGGQYAGRIYRATLARAGMLQSMSRADDCYDNAFMESCFGTIKRELQMVDMRTKHRQAVALREYIIYYNERRIHSSLDYQTPCQFETTTNP